MEGMIFAAVTQFKNLQCSRILGVYPEGCAAFAKVSPNVVADESVMKTDEGMTMEQRYTVVCLVELCIFFPVIAGFVI